MNEPGAGASFRARCRAMIRALSPSRSDDWVEEAHPFIANTSRAVDIIHAYPLSSTAEPASEFMPPPGNKNVPNRDCGHGNATSPIDIGTQPLPPLRHCTDPDDLTRLSIVDLAQAIGQGKLSPTELLEALLTRIEATDDIVRAWEIIAREQATVRVRQAEGSLRTGARLGLLHGIPFGVKDNIRIKGMPATNGSRLFEPHISPTDADAVAALTQFGAIPIGKTTTTEMAIGDAPSTRNPWNPAHTPGGSSSGSAAAVAAGHVPFALATQTGGSINRPAAYCGLTGLKPTYGRVSRRGVFPLSWTMDHVGVVARSALDAATVAAHLYDDKAFRTPTGRSTGQSIRGVKIGRPDRYFFAELHPEQRAAYDEALRLLEKDFGAIIIDVPLPTAFEAAAAAHTIIMQCDAAAAYGSLLRQRPHAAGPMLRSRLLCGEATGATTYVRAQQIRRAYIEQLHTMFECIDVLATPTTPGPAPEGIPRTGPSVFNTPFSISGFPTVVFPTGFTTDTNLPLSAQFVAPPLREDGLLDIAMAYERATDWHLRRPPVESAQTSQ